MDDNQKPKRRFSYVWPLAGLYLLLLAYRLVRDALDGTTAYPVMALAGAAAFIAIGGFLLYREWKTYRYDLAHKDDPSTWSDDPAVWADAEEDGQLPESPADEPENGREEDET